MSNFWVMKTFKEWAGDFIANEEIGLDESGVDNNYTNYSVAQLSSVLDNPRLLRRFDQFCKWAKVGDYVIVGIGQQTKFNMKLVGRIIGDYEFEASHQPYRHFRKIELLKVFENPIPIEKWGQIQRIELVDDNDFIDTLVKSI
ncbi:hypothetical protein [Peribacillus asahii]|uniref:hypothetical protein n=2 Tax=Peribacillus asahii TaxID=228899 RepID=UPI002079FAA1|nr:hypothetical protein [Peribacillus asahii]USK70051.1 hypothetical protein LIS76_21585 [Peribacillus asahii]